MGDRGGNLPSARRRRISNETESGSIKETKTSPYSMGDDQRTESRSMEETKEQNPNLRPRKSDVRRHERDPRNWAEMREKEDSGSRRRDKSYQILHQKESYEDTLRQPRVRGVEMKHQIRRETESNRYQATNLDERNQHDYPSRPGIRICGSYLRTGLCDRGINCTFNHPRCTFFLRGSCKDGSACRYLHAEDSDATRLRTHQATSSNMRNLTKFSHQKERDGAEPIRQGSRRHETESAYWEEEKETKDWVFNIEKKYNRSLTQICDDIVAGYMRAKMEKEQRHAHEDLQKQKERDKTEWQRYSEMKWREAQEKGQEQRLMEKHKVDAHAHDQPNKEGD